MAQPILTLFSTRLASPLFAAYLKGIGCQRIAQSAERAFEVWIDFEFAHHAFVAHRDFASWHFFAEDNCPAEVSAQLVQLMKTHNSGWQMAWQVGKGLLGRRS